MEIQTETTKQIKWDLPGSGKFQVVLSNNNIIKLEFISESGSPGEELVCTNEKHLRNICKALTDLFKHIDGPENNNRG